MQLDAALSEIEAQLHAVQAALLTSDTDALEPAADQARSAITALAQVFRGAPNPLPGAALRRAQALSFQLGQVRNQLARVLSLTRQQASTLLPPLQNATYGPSSVSGPRVYHAQSY